MAKTLKDKLVDMVVMTIARDATRNVINQAKKVYKATKATKEQTSVHKRSNSDVDESLEP